MIMFPKSQVDKFRHVNKSKRYGQAIYDFLKLEKVHNPQDKEFCDRLYYAKDEKAKTMVMSRLDYEN